MPFSSPAELLTVEEPLEVLPPGGGPFSTVYIANQSFFLLDVSIDGSTRSPLQSAQNAPYTALERSPGQITRVTVTAHLYPGQTPPPAGSSSAVSVTWYGPREEPPPPGFSPVFTPAVDLTGTAPVGVINMFGGAAAPAGWAVCDGAELSRAAFPDLFLVIGTLWGAGNGSTTFNLPDLRGRAPVGAGAGAGLTNRTLGSTFGAETVTLATGDIPAHNHAVTDPTHNHGGSDPTHQHTANHGHSVTDPSHNHGAPATGGGFLFEDPIGDPLNFDGSGGPLINLGGTASAVTGVTVVSSNVNTSGNATGISISASATGVTTNNAGGGAAHPNVQPAAAVGFIIKTT